MKKPCCRYLGVFRADGISRAEHLGHDCAFMFKEKHCYIWYNVQEVRRLVGGQWRGQKCSTGRQFGESFEKNVTWVKGKKTWWKLLRRDQEKQEWKAEDGQEATVLSEEGANWWWPEQGGHTVGWRTGQDVDMSSRFTQWDLLRRAVRGIGWLQDFSLNN